MNLYEISEQDILNIVEKEKRTFIPGQKFSIIDNSLTKFKHPIKIVGEQSEDSILIVTAYPVKNRREQ